MRERLPSACHRFDNLKGSLCYTAAIASEVLPGAVNHAAQHCGQCILLLGLPFRVRRCCFCCSRGAGGRSCAQLLHLSFASPSRFLHLTFVVVDDAGVSPLRKTALIEKQAGKLSFSAIRWQWWEVSLRDRDRALAHTTSGIIPWVGSSSSGGCSRTARAIAPRITISSSNGACSRTASGITPWVNISISSGRRRWRRRRLVLQARFLLVTAAPILLLLRIDVCCIGGFSRCTCSSTVHNLRNSIASGFQTLVHNLVASSFHHQEVHFYSTPRLPYPVDPGLRLLNDAGHGGAQLAEDAQAGGCKGEPLACRRD
mmetsp:Transcript_43621/g.102862  ORF Transcript_43621/g.102862 Transcript_43621/m.102862 type:complete len:314 (-) Transcript_43621:1529-2470(-)